jgi:hypothetical protein
MCRREAACGSAIRYPSEVQRIYVALSAPNTTPAGWSAVIANIQEAGTDAWPVTSAPVNSVPD